MLHPACLWPKPIAWVSTPDYQLGNISNTLYKAQGRFPFGCWCRPEGLFYLYQCMSSYIFLFALDSHAISTCKRLFQLHLCQLVCLKLTKAVVTYNFTSIPMIHIVGAEKLLPSHVSLLLWAMSMKLDHPAIQWAHKLCDIWKLQFCGGARERSHKFILYKNHTFTIYYKPWTREWLAPIPIRKLGQTSLPRQQPPPFGNHSLVQLESYRVQESFCKHPVHRLGAKINENA